MILGEVFKSIEDIWVESSRDGRISQMKGTTGSLSWAEIRQLFPYIRNSAFIGTAIGALPGIGSTLAATLGYSAGRRRHSRKNQPMGPGFGDGAPEGVASTEAANSSVSGANLIPELFPYIRNSAFIGTAIGALPGIGSTLAATLGYSAGRRRHSRKNQPMGPGFGDGAPEGVASTEAANSSVSGANLIPVLSLGIPGNASAVFLVLATDSISGFNPGPSVFKFTQESINPELVMVFGIFTLMVTANILNWFLGSHIMGMMGVMIRVPKQILLPIILLLTLTALHVQEASMSAMGFAFGFGLLGYFMRRLGISILPFIIAFILAGSLEQTARQAFSASGGNAWFLFDSPISIGLMVIAVAVIFLFSRNSHQSK